jgi:hypothetical protein
MATAPISTVELHTQDFEKPPRVISSNENSGWLQLVMPIAVLACLGSILSLVFQDAIYGKETDNWAAQSVGQDIANLIAFPLMMAAAFFASRGSVRACLFTIGLLIYSAYTYAIYTFALHFGPLFLMWVAVFGLSIYALIGAFVSIDAARVKREFARGAGERFAARLLMGIGCAFGVLWLSEIIPATLTGGTPEALREVGLLTNPVHVLDLGLLLPALVITGRSLRRRRPIAYVLAPALLTATVFLGLGIISLMIVSAVRGIESAPVVGVAMAVLVLVEAVTVLRLLRPLHGLG